MTRIPRFAAFWILFTFAALSSMAQTRPLAGTVVDIDTGRSRIDIRTDDAEEMLMTIDTDAVSTTYYGFGTVIADKPEIFTGSKGFSNLRIGDRVQITGVIDGDVYRAGRITLVGRDVAAAPVGVGQTRSPGTVATPTAPPVTADTVTGRIEGTVRDINESEDRLVLQTTDRRLITVRTYRTTPVYYRGTRYNISNLEIGDRIRIEPDTRDTQADEITARRIDVTVSVQDAAPDVATGARITTIGGTVTRTETSLNQAMLDTGRGEVRLDMRRAEDARGEILHARDLRVGDRLEITGSYNQAGDTFLASTVRLIRGNAGGENVFLGEAGRFSIVTMTGSIVETLEDGATLAFRDRDTNQTVRIWVIGDFIVTTRNNTYTSARSLRTNDTVLIDAYRDSNGNLIAQTIRLRNR